MKDGILIKSYTSFAQQLKSVRDLTSLFKISEIVLWAKSLGHPLKSSVSRGKIDFSQGRDKIRPGVPEMMRENNYFFLKKNWSSNTKMSDTSYDNNSYLYVCLISLLEYIANYNPFCLPHIISKDEYNHVRTKRFHQHLSNAVAWELGSSPPCQGSNPAPSLTMCIKKKKN